MKRRGFIIGLGAAASVGAGTLGTGAITQITADRNVQLRISQDSNAYLGLKPSTPTDLVTDDSFEGDLKIDLTAFNDIADGDGFNARATSELTDPAALDGSSGEALFQIRNQSDRSVDVTAVTVGGPSDLGDVRPIDPGEEIEGPDGDEIKIEFFDVTDPDRIAIDYENPRTLTTGDNIGVGIRVIVPKGAELGEKTLVVLLQATEN